jgi:hypothetical protein
MVATIKLPSHAYGVRDMTGLGALDVLYTVTPSSPAAPPGPEPELDGVLFGAWSAEPDLEALVFGTWSGTPTQYEFTPEDWSS